MASTTPNTILLQVNGGSEDERPVHEAIVVTAAVTPGDFLIWSSGSIRPHNVAADVDAPIMVAVENPYLDPRVTSTAAIDTDYAAAAIARFIYPQRGDQIYGWLEDGANVARGAALEMDGAGGLQAYTSGRIVAFADEALDNSAGGASARIKVRIS